VEAWKQMEDLVTIIVAVVTTKYESEVPGDASAKMVDGTGCAELD